MTIETLPPLTLPMQGALNQLDVFDGLWIAFTDVVERTYDLPDAIRDSAPSRRREFGAGRLCAAHAARRAGASDPVVIGRKQRQPVWPDGLVGSITHSASVAGAACARRTGYRGVGIDIETIARMRLELHATVLTAREADLAAARAVCSPYAARAFCAKEAGYKAINPTTGQFIGFKEAEIDFDDPDASVTPFTIRYLGDHAGSRALHAGRGISVIVADCCASVFVIPAQAGRSA